MRPFASLVESLRAGRIDRRRFMQAATSLGVASGVALFCANATLAGPSRNGFALYPGQDATPATSPTAGTTTFPTIGTEGKTRGQDGELRILQWQAISSMFSHRASGTKDFMASDMVSEPLMRYNTDSSLGANLITEIPSVENGLLAEDLSSVTFTLKPGVLWSDGEPFTAEDVAFTWRWVLSDTSAAVTQDVWSVISNIEVIDDLTARVSYARPSAAWFDPFTGGANGQILPAHYWGGDVTNTEASDAFQMSPIGTGPFVVESFAAQDTVTFVANENYRDPNKPCFSRVVIKGGGDAAAAARAVIQTGEYDFAWNLQIDPDLVASLTADPNAPGEMVIAPGTQVERISLNFADPNTEVNGQKSELNTPNPCLADPAVREAINLAIPRDEIATSFYSDVEPATANILTGVDAFTSPNTSWAFDLEKAASILDDAGWTLNGDIREEDGVPLKLTFVTSINAVRQQTQAVVKSSLAKIGIQVEIQQVDSGIFFDSSAGNDQNFVHMYHDMNMLASNPTSSVPISYMNSWYSGPDNRNVPQKENSWAGNNIQRWISPEYDALFDELQRATTLDEANALLISLNDLVIENRVVIPLVNRAADAFAIAKKLQVENIALGAGFELDYWNIANWTLKPE